jgi:hypothetical protein
LADFFAKLEFSRGFLYIQGGSDISIPERLQSFTVALKNYFLSAKPSQLSAETYIKTNSRTPAKMKQQEGARAGTVFGLCAERTMMEIRGFWKHQ